MMKILITTDLYTTETNGVSVSVRNLASELKSRGEDVRILTLSQDRYSHMEDSVYYIGSFSLEKVYPGVRGAICIRSALLDELIAWNPDVIHSQCEFFTYSFAKRIAHRTGTPIVHTYHTLYEQYSQYVISNQVLGSYLVRKLVKWRLHSASEIIAPTKKAENILINYQINKPIHVVPTGLDLSQFHRRITPEQRERMQARYGIEKSDFVLVYIGRFGAEKSIGDLLMLLSWALMEQPHTKLLLVGDGPEREHLKAEAARLNVQDHVIFTGMVTPGEVSEYYQLGDVFVSASTSETQGLTYVEAAASGLPLICASDPCLDGVLQSGINGVAFDTMEEFVSAVSVLREDPAFRYKAGSYSRTMASRFDKRIFAESAEAVYASASELCEGHGVTKQSMTTLPSFNRHKFHTTYPMLLCLFFFGSIFGFLLEGVWFFFKHGQLESHSALVWGPFCIVYGFGAIAVYLMAILLHRKKWPIQFVAFTVAGGAVEYFTGLFQELVFGSTSWDYSKHFLSLGGHVSLKMAVLWGAIGIVFIRLLYPLLCQLQAKLKGKAVRLACVLVSAFLIMDMAVSGAAVLRWKDRQNDVPAAGKIDALLDTYYGDEKMEQIYSNLTFK